MIETPQTARIQAAYKAAHAERAQALQNILNWLFRPRHVPLNQTVLTEPCR